MRHILVSETSVVGRSNADKSPIPDGFTLVEVPDDHEFFNPDTSRLYEVVNNHPEAPSIRYLSDEEVAVLTIEEDVTPEPESGS